MLLLGEYLKAHVGPPDPNYEPPVYVDWELDLVKNQPDVNSLTDFIVQPQHENTSGKVVTAKVGVNNRGHLMVEDGHLFALPCPPYCDKGEDGHPQ